MRQDPPPTSFSTLFSGASSLAWIKLATDPQLVPLLAEYRPWRKFKHVAKDAGLDPELAWRAAKFARMPNWKELNDLQRTEGGAFGYTLGPQLLQPLHRIDRATGGGGPAAFNPVTGAMADQASRQRFSIRTLMDEAAESAMIEGAATTRSEARDLLRSGRAPKTPGERMVLNNYVGMQHIKRWIDRDLTVDMLCELQTILTDKTLDDPTAAGRLRRSDEMVRVQDARDGSTLYIPPPADRLPDRLKALCRFANQIHTGDAFIHPIIKASILHFMIGYEHPFVDGNGRTARAVFYWFALKHGYNIFEFLAISEIIRKGFARYPQAYVDTEQDDGDLTYFVLFNLNVIEQSLDRLTQHIHDEEAKIQRSQRLLKVARDLNLRQRLLLEHSLRHPGTQYTAKSHMTSNGITINTARADLEALVRRRLLTRSKRGRQMIYHPVTGLIDRLTRKGL